VSSRYDTDTVLTVIVPDGRGGTSEVRYLPRRLPIDPDTSPLAVHRVTEADRLDVLAERYLGDPSAAWMIAEANRALDPAALIGPSAVGRLLRIPTPGL
jgi:hypothetical protein